jgi:hypothetical protein
MMRRPGTTCRASLFGSEMTQKIQAILAPRAVTPKTLAQAMKDVVEAGRQMGAADEQRRFYAATLMKRAVPMLTLFEDTPVIVDAPESSGLYWRKFDWGESSQGAARP